MEEPSTVDTMQETSVVDATQETVVDRTGLKRKLDESESPSEQPLPDPATSSDNIELNLPDHVIEADSVSDVGKLDDMVLHEADLIPQDIPVSVADASEEIPDQQPAESLLLTEPAASVVTTAELPDLTSEPAAPETSLPVEATEPVAQLPVTMESLDLPSLDASLPVTSSSVISTASTSQPAKEDPAPVVSENITIKHEEVHIKHEIPPLGPSDEALISECEKLLEENREFEKSQMDQDQDDNDDQHSSDTVSVDSDTAKAQEDDFKDDEPMDVDAPIKIDPSPVKPEDPLSTLASAALGIKPPSLSLKNGSKEAKKKNATPWCDVGVFNSPACVVSGFYANQDTNEYTGITSSNLPNFEGLLKQSLEPGTAYKFRVCAVNSCGRGPWSEVSAFRTCLPGFPGAPSSIKISKSPDGANISWHPPSSPSGNIIEYSVCLAIKKYNHRNEEIKPNPAALTFEKVYSGASNHAVVSHVALNNAYVDTTNKPAIIFRIAAKNEKGYGPATQVRWLQDVYVSKK